MKNNTKQKEEKKQPTRLGFWLVSGLIFGGLVTGGVYLYNQSQKKTRKDDFEDKDNPQPESSNSGTGPASSSGTPRPKRDDNFPLKKGSKGPRVAVLQNALIAKYGKSILPRFGADADWGNETENALRRVGWPTFFNSETFNSYFPTGGKTGVANPHDAAWNLHQASKRKDWATADSILKKMSNTSDYVAVRTSFVTWPFKGSANYTPVNALLTSFPGKRTAIEAHFRRMGLKKKGQKWSLSGLGNLPGFGRMVRSRVQTSIWMDDLSISIPPSLVLGREIQSKGGFTKFINGNGEQYFVHTEDVEFA